MLATIAIVLGFGSSDKLAAAFGLIGLFIGPIVLAVALAIWREWVGALDIVSN